MEHANEVTAEFYAVADERGAVSVRQARPSRVVAVIPHDINGLPGREGWKWGTRVARGLCYETAGLRRAHRSGVRGLLIGLALGGVLMFAGMVGQGYVPGSRCVEVIPNG